MVRVLNLDAGGKAIVILNEKDAFELGVGPLNRIVIRKGRKNITAVVNITDKFVKPGEMVVYSEVRKVLKLKTGMHVTVEPRKELMSKKYIRKKIRGMELNYEEAKEIVNDVLQRNLNDLELASFITALHIHGMSVNESYAFSRAMIETSQVLHFKGLVVDKHSIGGCPGDKTSILVVPIVAAAGLTIPKTSSRSITSPAGTADRVEVLMPVSLSMKKIQNVVEKTGGCLVWGGALDLAPADDLFIRIEHPLSLDPLMLASVMSKKKVVGSKYVVIDIPTGPEAKVKTKKDAEKLAKKFISLGRKLKINVDCAITNGSQPIGYAMGPALEAREALGVIMGIESCPDLVEKATSIAGLIFEMVHKGDKKAAQKILLSGEAEKKLREIIAAQGGNPKIKPKDIPYSKKKYKVKAKRSGAVSYISNRILAEIAKIAGAPSDKFAGVLLNKKLEDNVKKGELLYTIYAEKTEKLKKAVLAAKQNNGFIISKPEKQRMLLEKVR
jgi:AMP phosphorylase